MAAHAARALSVVAFWLSHADAVEVVPGIPAAICAGVGFGPVIRYDANGLAACCAGALGLGISTPVSLS